MIYTHIPYCPKDKGNDLGYAYNTFMEKLSDDDWACFLDHDAMFTTSNWYHQLEEIINKYPDAGLFTSMTNRVANPDQIFKELIYFENHDIKLHRKAGEYLQNIYGTDVLDVTTNKLISGVVILIKKKVWIDIGKFKSGFLGVDNDIHQKCSLYGYKTYIMKGVYVYHWYRGEKDLKNAIQKYKINNG